MRRAILVTGVLLGASVSILLDNYGGTGAASIQVLHRLTLTLSSGPGATTGLEVFDNAPSQSRGQGSPSSVLEQVPAQVVQDQPVAVQNEPLPQLVRRHAGLYLDKTRAPELSNVLLLTAANYGYLDMLQNWECYARKLGLDWLVVAMDDKIFKELGSARSFLTAGERLDGYERFGSPGFKIVGCNKLRSMFRVLVEAQLDVVFSDGDSVFKSDPFLPSLSLGSMIRSGKYDMIYGRKIKPPGVSKDEYHQEPIKGNTGFYYVSGTRKPRIMQRMFNISIEWCDKRPGLDDQENFWDALVFERKRQPSDKSFFACFRHCDSTQCGGVEPDSVFDYCDMSPWEYLDGAIHPNDAVKAPYQMVSYHATWVFGKEAKQKKLKMVDLWDQRCASQGSSVQGAPSSVLEQVPAQVVQDQPVAVQNEPLPQLVRRHAGLYLDKTRAPELSNVLLLTAANYGYLDMLQNWECYARKLGLDWLVVAMDDKIFKELGSARSFLTVGERLDGYERFGSPGFKIVGCNKLRSMFRVLVEAQLDVVFSDGDSVFKSDPFLPSLSLGSMIRSGKYDMIYGRKIKPPGVSKDEYHQEPIKGNTGFYYVSGTRKPRIMQRMFNISIEWCDKRPGLDDQENFWDALVFERKRQPSDKSFFACFRHCDSTQCGGVEPDSVFDYCDMSPWEYLDGAIHPNDAVKAPYQMVSYHATWVFGKEAKQKKLKMVDLWDQRCASQGSSVQGAPSSVLEQVPAQVVQDQPVAVQNEPLPQLVRRHAGLYLDKTRAPELSNVLLLTAANYGYLDMLQNWECYARKLGLDWLVVAMDDKIFKELGSARSFLTVGERLDGYERFGSPGFKIVGCNKLRSMFRVLVEAQLDVVFSDGDSVFKSDPFLPSLSLGSMIRSGKYDMIYGRKIKPPGVSKDEYHQEPIKGNTGFYYVSGTRKPRIMQRMFNISIEWCDKRPGLDDQENFWDALVFERKRQPSDKSFFACFRHCDSTQCGGVEPDSVFDYCDMSPWEYLDGAIHPNDAVKAPYQMVSYHATWVFGKEAKQKKLKMVDLWDQRCASQGSSVQGAPSSVLEQVPAQVVQDQPVAVQNEPLPQLVRRHAGLYLDKTRAPELSNVLLLTAANYGYLDMLQNWECYARKLGLDWLVVAMDDKIFKELGSARSFLTVGERLDGYERFGSPGFKIVGCNKLRSMFRVLVEAQLDVVFSDGDSVFKSDPFLPSLSLGSMIRSGKYDMIYGRKIVPPGAKKDEYHQEPIKGNTGFYYVSGTRKPRIMQRMFNISIEWCDKRPGLDDQENFWDALVFERKRQPSDKSFFACFRHCDSTQCSGVESDSVFDYCDMSPWEYLDGAIHPNDAVKAPYQMVSYHATWVFGKEAKQKKLKMVDLWDPQCRTI